MSITTDLLQNIVLLPLTLLPIINPLSSAPVFSMTAGTDPKTVARLARQVAINCWIVIAASILVGTYVLDLFGISLPVVRIGGGLLVAASGWRMLNSRDDDAVSQAIKRDAKALSPSELARRSFFPITFPLTAGPGTIAASIALGAGMPRQPALLYVASASAALVGAAITVAVIYLIYRNTGRLLARLGELGTLVMMRLMAFVLLCIGIQIIWTGWAELNGIGLN